MSEQEQRPFVPPAEFVEKSAPVSHLMPEAPPVPVSAPEPPIPQTFAPNQHLVPSPPPDTSKE
jgi:hypothetical protein